MKMSDIVIDAQKTLGEKKLLINVSPSYKYENNIRTESVDGFKYEIVLPEKEFEKINVKIEGNQKIESPEGYTPVEFDGLELKHYLFQWKYLISGTAKDIRVVKKS